jgi:hypothetical protein
MLDWLRKKLLSDSTPPAAARIRRTPSTEATEYQVLENRQLMATLLSSLAVSYQDVDGDRVTVNFSGRFLTAGNVNSIFQFDTGSVDGSNAARQQLRSLNLGSVPGAAADQHHHHRRTSRWTSQQRPHWTDHGRGIDLGCDDRQPWPDPRR